MVRRAKPPEKPTGLFHAREYRGMSQDDLARAAKVSKGQISKLEGGGGETRKLTRQWAERFEKVLKIPADRILFWDKYGPPTESDHVESEHVIGTEQLEEGADIKGGIREIDVRAGLGGGGTTDGREVIHHGQYSDPLKEDAWRFPERFMREELRAPESRVIILETQGDSMSPTILSGDRVIVDTGHTIPSPDGVYAIRDQYGMIVVKRLQTLRRGDPPTIRIISDNKSHDAEDVGADEVAIVGRVLWGLKRL